MATHISPKQIMPGRLPATPANERMTAVAAALPRQARPAPVHDIVPSALPLKHRVQGQVSAQDSNAPSALAYRAAPKGAEPADGDRE